MPCNFLLFLINLPFFLNKNYFFFPQNSLLYSFKSQNLVSQNLVPTPCFNQQWNHHGNLLGFVGFQGKSKKDKQNLLKKLPFTISSLPLKSFRSRVDLTFTSKHDIKPLLAFSIYISSMPIDNDVTIYVHNLLTIILKILTV